MKKRLGSYFIIGIFILLISSQILWAQEQGRSVNLTINHPVTRMNKVSMVPAASILKQLGDSYKWIQEDRKLEVNQGELILQVGSLQVLGEKEDYKLETAPILKEGRLYVPLKFFSDVLGYNISYKNKVIQIEGTQKIGVKGKYQEVLDEKYITISAAGDFTLGYYKGQGKGGRFDEVARSNDYAYFMKNVKSVFEEDDLTIVNLEGPLTTRGTAAEKEFAIRGLPEYANILLEGDIEAVNLANNHTKDYGTIGYEDTKNVLSQNKIGYFGADQTYFTEVNGIRVALIGLSAWSDTKAVRESLKARLTAAKKQADLVIVEFHWGVEKEHYPSSYQKSLAKFAIDEGAYLILGSHPHVVQGIGSYKGTNIVYSMGNFCFGANKNPNDKDTFIYQETFVLTEDGIYSESSQIIPCSISSVDHKNNYQPTVLTGVDKEHVLKRMEIYSKGLKQ